MKQTGSEWDQRTLLGVVRRHARVFLILPALASLGTAIVTLMSARTYTSTATFIPRGGDALKAGALGGLAAQFGVNVPASDPTQSPDFFAAIVASRPMLEQLAADTFRLRPDARPTRLYVLLDAKGATPPARIDDAARKLEHDISTARDLKTGIISVSARAQEPTLASDEAQRLVTQVDALNQTLRQSKATSEMQFSEDRLQALRRDLADAENQLLAFHLQNRSYVNAPELAAREQQLQRNVSLRQQVFTTFAQLYEQARMDAARNTPVILEVSAPEPAVRPDSRHVVAKIILALLAGLLAAGVIGFALDARSVVRAGAR